MLQGTKTISKAFNKVGFSPYWTLRGTPATLKKLTIVMYHSVHPRPAPHSVSPEDFLRQITFLKENYTISALREIDHFLLDRVDRNRKVWRRLPRSLFKKGIVLRNLDRKASPQEVKGRHSEPRLGFGTVQNASGLPIQEP